VVERLLSDPGVRVADAAEHVVVVLEDVRVDRPQADPEVPGMAGESGVVAATGIALLLSSTS
jgi:hypothetical protein